MSESLVSTTNILLMDRTAVWESGWQKENSSAVTDGPFIPRYCTWLYCCDAQWSSSPLYDTENVRL